METRGKEARFGEVLVVFLELRTLVPAQAGKERSRSAALLAVTIYS